MSVTPQITLTATLLDYSGNEQGSATQPAWLRIALCGFGPYLPAIPGTANLAKVSSWFVDIPYTGSQITVALWGNDVINPLNQTYYAISVLDTNKNVLQTGNYQFTGMQTIDLSSAAQIIPGQLPGIDQLVDEICDGAVPGTTYTAPGQVIAVFYNGVKLPKAQALPVLSYTLTGTMVINLNFTTQVGDEISALCIVN